MCGITGIWHPEGGTVSEAKIRRFTDALQDRGPDGSGFDFLDQGRLAFGHRRLSILDLSEGGRQPMTYGDGRFTITFNGEIYNFLEVRKELSGKGYKFITSSDTEVILAAFHCWGRQCFNKLNGMFAFAIYDAAAHKLIIARDRFGVKPLHYIFRKGLFAFASETYAFRFLDDYSRKFNAKHFSLAIEDPEYLEGSGHTIFEEIFQLLPGHYLELGPGSKLVQQKRWWSTREHLHQVPAKYEDQVEEFRELLTDACRIRLRSDVPVASALSGGVDSSAIYCIVNQLLKQGNQERISESEQQAFVAYYPGTPNDEKVYAEEVIRYTGGKATYLETDFSNLTAELLQTTARFDAVAGTPVMCASDVYKGMRRSGYKVSMDGHGADEMLFGYKQMVLDAFQDAVLNGDGSFEEQCRQTYAGLFFPADRTMAYSYLGGYGEQIRPRGLKQVARKMLPGFFSKRAATNIYNKNSARGLADSWLRGNFQKSLLPLSNSYYAGHLDGDASAKAYNMYHYTSLPANLRDFDRASMQSSVEIRSPFMDYRLASFVFSLPVQSKLGGGFTKRILRDAMHNRMPESIRTRKLKIGLSAPLPSWFSGELKQFIDDMAGSASFRENQLWDGQAILDLIRERNKTGWTDFVECSHVWRFINAQILINNNN